MKALGFQRFDQLKVHPFQSSGFRCAPLHRGGGVDAEGGEGEGEGRGEGGGGQGKGRDALPALVIGRRYIIERDSAPVQFNGVV